MALQPTVLPRKPGNLENLCQAKIFWNHFRDPIILEGCYELSQAPHQKNLKYILRQNYIDQHLLFLLVTNPPEVPFSSQKLCIHSMGAVTGID